MCAPKTLETILKKLCDPDFEIVSTEGLDLIDTLIGLYTSEFEDDLIDMCMYQAMLRLRCDSPHVFAFTADKVPGYEHIRERWDTEGYIGIDGKLWLAPTTFGSYNMRKRG